MVETFRVRPSVWKWVMTIRYTEEQARRILEDYDDLPMTERAKSKSFSSVRNPFIVYTFCKMTDGSVIMTRENLDR